MKHQLPEPFLVPSLPTVQQAPVFKKLSLLAVTEELPIPEGVPCTGLFSKPDTSQPASSRQPVKKSSAASESKQSRTWKLGVLLIVIALIVSFGLAAVFWSDLPGYLVVHSGAPTQNVKLAKLTPTPPSVSSIYPMLIGTYSGTIYDLSRNISTSMLLTGMRQNQGNVSGYLTLGSKLQGSGHFSGTIDTTKELKFVVTDSEGNAILYFEGVMQSATGLTGDYYRCSPVGFSQGEQCKQAPGSYGIWNIVLLS